MRKIKSVFPSPFVLSIVVLALSFATVVQAKDAPRDLPAIMADLPMIMQNVPSYGHLSDGLRATRAGNTRLAYDMFLASSRGANKIAQFKLGLMYLEGFRGPSDAERAWAWMELASERNYPQFREVADQLWLTLDEDEQAGALQILRDELRPHFGDEVAVPRVAAAMRRAHRNQTGTRVGYGGSSLQVVDASSITPSGRGTYLNNEGGLFLTSGQIFYQVDKWDFNQLVALEKKVFRSEGRVTIRDAPSEE